MDNIAHALTGAALGEAGLKRLTGLAMPVLILSANVPDIDAIAFFTGGSLGFRRGWSHGPIALVILPALVALVMLAFDRWQTRRGTRPAKRLPVYPKQLLLLSYIGAISHILLDLLNSYGVRLLMPFSERWFYGDVLFIVDPWIWLGLGLGVWFSRRSAGGRKRTISITAPAIGALLGATLYIGAMYTGGRVAESIAAREFQGSGYGTPERVLASPVFANPLRREIVVETADGYRFGDLRWTPSPHLNFEDASVPTNINDPAIDRAAAQDQQFADFLYWSRFPFAIIDETECGTRVTIGDGRYSRRPNTGPFTTSVLLVEPGATNTAECP